MKHKTLTILILLFSLFLLTGCGETEEDKINSTDPKKYATNAIKDKYDIDIEITKQSKEYYKYSESDRGYEYVYYEAKTKDDKETEFIITTYWKVSDAIPTRHYTYDTNYENIINKEILEEYFKDTENMTLSSSKTDKKLYKYIEEYVFKLNVNNLNDLDNILYELSQKEELYPLSITINYYNKNISIPLNKDIKLEDITKKIENLK